MNSVQILHIVFDISNVLLLVYLLLFPLSLPLQLFVDLLLTHYHVDFNSVIWCQQVDDIVLEMAVYYFAIALSLNAAYFFVILVITIAVFMELDGHEFQFIL